MIFKNNNFECNINIKDNPLNLDISDYLEMGLRNNKKRRFLFILKRLGKHLATNPSQIDDLGKDLVDVYNKRALEGLVKKHSKATVISFAETATALGYSVFKYLDENANEFIHTTREFDLEIENYIEFLEEHSHASNHKLYTDNLKNIESNDTIILVDDEITTAKTCVNIIRQLQEIYPNKNYVIFSVLNWITKEREEEIYREVSEIGECSISFNYLFRGDFEFELLNTKEDDFKLENNSIDCKISNINMSFKNTTTLSYIGSKYYLKYTGRFGITRSDINELNSIIDREVVKLNKHIKDTDKVLCLGTEEFMNVPIEIARKLNSNNVSFFATTRSPIISLNDDTYPINSRIDFRSSYNENIVNHLYNIDKTKYDKCFIFLETNIINYNKSVIDAISKNINCENIILVDF